MQEFCEFRHLMHDKIWLFKKWSTIVDIIFLAFSYWMTRRANCRWSWCGAHLQVKLMPVYYTRITVTLLGIDIKWFLHFHLCWLCMMVGAKFLYYIYILAYCFFFFLLVCYIRDKQIFAPSLTVSEFTENGTVLRLNF